MAPWSPAVGNEKELQPPQRENCRRPGPDGKGCYQDLRRSELPSDMAPIGELRRRSETLAWASRSFALEQRTS
jgi:hypothetical protein